MANKKATMTDLRLLIREFIKGTSKRKISEKLNLSRTSVDVYVGRGKSAEELLHGDDRTLCQVMVRDSGHRNTDNEKLEELTPLLEDYARQVQLRNMTYQLLFENYSHRVAHPYPTLYLFMAKMVEAEIQYKNRKRTEMYLRTSRLRYNTVMEDVICSEERNLTKQTLQELADCDFIPRAQNLLITGRTGCGKSFLACALGRQACLLGHRVEYYSMNRFIEKISMAKVDGTLLKVINHIEKNALVIFDDFGLQPLDDNSRLALLQILEDCYERKSVIITSQLPVAKWYDYIKEPTLADAIMDRLAANARRIELKGESLRRKSK